MNDADRSPIEAVAARRLESRSFSLPGPRHAVQETFPERVRSFWLWTCSGGVFLNDVELRLILTLGHETISLLIFQELTSVSPHAGHCAHAQVRAVDSYE